MATKNASGMASLQKQINTTEPPNIEVRKESPTAVEPESKDPEPKRENPQAKKKRKVGRPKTKDIKNTCRTINVAVPITLLDKWEDIKIVHGSNLTEYLTKLIEKDMNLNYGHYKEIADSLKNI